MLKQGDIIKTTLDPTKGHEQAGFRPVLVISSSIFTQATNLTLICPITNTNRKRAMHIKINDDNLQTTGFIMTEQVRAFDLNDRSYKFVEHAPNEITEKVSNLIKASVDLVDE